MPNTASETTIAPLESPKLGEPYLLTPGPLREDLLEAAGIDGLLVLDFTTEFAQQSPEDFVRDTFARGLQAAAVVVGVDTRFGYRNSGDVSTLRDLGDRLGFEVHAIDDVGGGTRWSSTSVRAHLRAGEVAQAAVILGRPHRVVGTVVHGHHRGRELGYPTANLSADSLGLIPAEGVYAGWLTRLDQPVGTVDRTMPCAISRSRCRGSGPWSAAIRVSASRASTWFRRAS